MFELIIFIGLVVGMITLFILIPETIIDCFKNGDYFWGIAFIFLGLFILTLIAILILRHFVWGNI